jgi:hypothetical protein
VCRPDPRYDEGDRRVIDTVLQHGWQVLAVSDDGCCEDPGHHEHADAESGPPIAYTVGLGHRSAHPEILMSGLDLGLMHGVLNSVAQRVMAGRRQRAGDVLEDVLGGVPVVVAEVREEALRETVTWSGWFHRRRPEAFVLVWPSTSGLFSWQPGAPDVLDELQPPAWRVPQDPPEGLEQDPAWTFPVPPDRTAFSCTHVVDEGAAVLWVARQSDPDRVEDWSLHCGAAGHDADEMRGVHLAHLVRGAPSVRALSGLGLDVEAFRQDTDSDWTLTRLPVES